MQIRTVTTVLVHGKGDAATALAALRVAINR
jgi:hypothetical protein